MRTIVELLDPQVEALARLCRKKGISRAEAIRRAVDKMVADDEAAGAAENRRAGFGLWQGRKAESRSYVGALRVEWGDRDGKDPRG